MAQIAAWVFVVYGVTLIVNQSKIFAPIRSWSRLPTWVRKFLSCPMCVGFWVGVAVHFLPVTWGLCTPTRAAWLDGFASSGINFILYAWFYVPAEEGTKNDGA